MASQEEKENITRNKKRETHTLNCIDDDKTKQKNVVIKYEMCRIFTNEKVIFYVILLPNFHFKILFHLVYVTSLTFFRVTHQWLLDGGECAS